VFEGAKFPSGERNSSLEEARTASDEEDEVKPPLEEGTAASPTQEGELRNFPCFF
jgi:hypothetical protein